MCTFIFRYTDGSEHEFNNINRVEYVRSSTIVVNSNELLTHRFPTKCDLHLFSETSNFTVSGIDLVWIEVAKEC